jgi:hypothetical protein
MDVDDDSSKPARLAHRRLARGRLAHGPSTTTTPLARLRWGALARRGGGLNVRSLRGCLNQAVRLGIIAFGLWLAFAPIATVSGAGGSDPAPSSMFDTHHAVDLPVRAPAAVSGYQAYYNPFGDPWETKTAPNQSFPEALTPACRKHGIKVGQTVPDEDEVTFISKSNTFALDGCAEPADTDNGVGDPALKAFIGAVHAKNPDLRYVGYVQPAIAVPGFLAGSGPYPVGLPAINQSHEDWFVHQKGAAPTSQNRVPSSVGFPVTVLYDTTNPAFRSFMADQIVKSMDFHGIWGISVDSCFDRPEVAAGYSIPDEVFNNWEGGCLDMLAQLKARLNPQGRKVYFWGLIHLGTQGAPSAVNEPAKFAFFQRRSQVANGMAWEDPFQGTNLSSDNVESNINRVNQIIGYTRQVGNYLIMATNATAGGQSSFGSPGDQRRFARYYSAAFLNFLTGPDLIMAYYTPTQAGDNFYSATFFREWNVRVGPALGGIEIPQQHVYLRRFQNGVAIWNYGEESYNATLGSGYTNPDGSAVTDFLIPPKDGRVWGIGDALTPPAPTPTPTPTLPPAACSPRPRVTIAATPTGGQLQVSVTATGANNRLVSLHFENTVNALIDAGSQTGLSGTFDVTISGQPTTTIFIVRRRGSGSVTVPLVVTDRCGTWRTFVGGGAGAF